jgi:hypothetical protein
MRLVVIIPLMFIAANSYAQAPQKMSYQAVIRNSGDVLVVSSAIGMKISVLQGSIAGSVVYSETQTPSTNANGLVSIEIGSGSPVTGIFSGINWANGPYFIKTEIDPTGGLSYTIVGVGELMSVPYAFFSANGLASGNNAGNTPYWDGVNWITTSSNLFNAGANVGINTTVPNAQLHINGSTDNTELIIQAVSGQSNTNPMVKLEDGNGLELLWINSDDPSNSFIGVNSGAQNIPALGGLNNVFSGYGTGSMNTIGNGNVATGSSALFSNTDGNNNVASGRNSLYSNTFGSDNVANGGFSLYGNTTGNNNVGIGRNSLYSNISGSDNVANGTSSLNSNTSGTSNVAIGTASLYSNFSGNNNVGAGMSSLYSNTIGSDNVGLGSLSLHDNTIGNNNVAAGRNSLYLNISGNDNMALGTNSLSNNINGNTNVAVGRDALNTTTSGSNNIGIGFNALVPSAVMNNQVRIGNTSVVYAGTQVAWSVTSDKRWKSNITTSNLGLDFITKLRPVSYTRNNDEAQKKEYGFIAQELEEVLNNSGAVDNGIIRKDDEGMLSVRYNDLIAPMVAAIQEQQKSILLQQEIIVAQQKQIDALKVAMEMLLKK